MKTLTYGLTSVCSGGGQNARFFRSLYPCVKGPLPLTFRAIRDLKSKAFELALRTVNGSEDKLLLYTGVQAPEKHGVLPPSRDATALLHFCIMDAV